MLVEKVSPAADQQESRAVGQPLEDMRPGQQLEAAQRQHADLRGLRICKLISAKVATLHTILLGVTGTCYIDRALNQIKELGLDHRRAKKVARKLHAHSMFCYVRQQAYYR
eukprot:1152670-Pelagomonas_calceolata.AAC.1